MHHHGASSWFIMMIQHAESWWFTMMNHDDAALWFTMRYLERIPFRAVSLVLKSAPSIGDAHYWWHPWIYSKPNTFKMIMSATQVSPQQTAMCTSPPVPQKCVFTSIWFYPDQVRLLCRDAGIDLPGWFGNSTVMFLKTSKDNVLASTLFFNIYRDIHQW